MNTQALPVHQQKILGGCHVSGALTEALQQILIIAEVKRVILDLND